MKADVGTDRVTHRKHKLLRAFVLVLGRFLLSYVKVQNPLLKSWDQMAYRPIVGPRSPSLNPVMER